VALEPKNATLSAPPDSHRTGLSSRGYIAGAEKMALCGRAVLFTQNQRGHYSKQIRADVNVESTNDCFAGSFLRGRIRAK
jgi:hypothetical protein